MANQQLQKTLFVLMSTSESILSLPIERRTQLREQMLKLNDDQMQHVIDALETEQRKMAAIKRGMANDATKIAALTRNVHMAAVKLKRNYAGAMEEEDQARSAKNSEDLLKQLDKAGKKKRFGIL